jgi:hypothetical protein
LMLVPCWQEWTSGVHAFSLVHAAWVAQASGLPQAGCKV